MTHGAWPQWHISTISTLEKLSQELFLYARCSGVIAATYRCHSACAIRVTITEIGCSHERTHGWPCASKFEIRPTIGPPQVVLFHFGEEKSLRDAMTKVVPSESLDQQHDAHHRAMAINSLNSKLDNNSSNLT